MSDVLTPKQRHLNMSRVRAKHTKPEMLLRRGLHALGFRYQLHRRDLAGCPDLTFPRYGTVVFVHGCFWHRHDCHLFQVPRTRTEFWMEKISRNVERDHSAVVALRSDGWRVLTVWECALRGRNQLGLDEVLRCSATFLGGKRKMLQLKGKRGKASSRSWTNTKTINLAYAS